MGQSPRGPFSRQHNSESSMLMVHEYYIVKSNHNWSTIGNTPNFHSKSYVCATDIGIYEIELSKQMSTDQAFHLCS